MNRKTSHSIANRKLFLAFRKFDKSDSETIDRHEFLAAMINLNFIGCTREVESMFNRYDADRSGSYSFSSMLYFVHN